MPILQALLPLVDDIALAMGVLWATVRVAQFVAAVEGAIEVLGTLDLSVEATMAVMTEATGGLYALVAAVGTLVNRVTLALTSSAAEMLGGDLGLGGLLAVPLGDGLGGHAGGGAFALQLGGSLLLSAVSSKLARKDVAKATMQGRTVSVRSPAASRRIVYGRARAGGTIVYIESRRGADKEDGILDLVIVLSGRPVQSIGAVYFDGEMAINAAGAAQGRYAGFATVQKQYGTETSSALSTLISVSATSGKWTAEHRMQGCAAIHVSLTTSPDVYPSGIPNISVDMGSSSSQELGRIRS
jgi:hypothetical protein